jgi:uncharacterized membrane protein
MATPSRTAELADEERAFRRAIRDPEDRKAYLLFRSGRSHRDVAQLLGRKVRDVRALERRLTSALACRLIA